MDNFFLFAYILNTDNQSLQPRKQLPINTIFIPPEFPQSEDMQIKPSQIKPTIVAISME